MAVLNKLPESWAELESCDCGDCRAMVAIRDECLRREEFLFVLDARPYGKGFRICDVRVLYERTAAEDEEFDLVEFAAAALLKRQAHCNVYMSNFAGSVRGLKWHRVSYEHPQDDDGTCLRGVLLRADW